MRDNPSLLEPVLRRHLGPVEAPPNLNYSELQYSLNVSPKVKSARPSRLVWAAAAAIFVIGSALGGHSYVRHAISIQATLQPASANSVRHDAAQAGVRFAMQVACQACHTSGEL